MMAITCEQGLEACTHLQCGQKDVESASYSNRQPLRAARSSESVTRLIGFGSRLLHLRQASSFCVA